MAKLTEPADLKQPIAVLTEHIAPCPTTLRLRRFVTAKDFWTTGGDYTVWECPDGNDHDKARGETKLFSVESTVESRSRRRNLRDASGLPIFTVLQKRGGVTWFVQLLGAKSTDEPIAVFAPRYDLFKNKIHVYVMNSAQDGQEVKLEVRGQNMFWKFTTEVYFNGVVIMSARAVNFGDHEWVIKVARGFDTSLATAIMLVAYMHFYPKATSSYHGAGGSNTKGA